MSGVQGLGSGNNVPLSFPPSGGPSFNILLTNEELDVFEPNPDYLQLTATPAISLPAGQFSVFEFAQIIAEVIRKLRESLQGSAYIDADISRKFYENAITEMDDLIALHLFVESLVNNWNNKLKEKGGNKAIGTSFYLNQDILAYNTLITNTVSDDRTNVLSVNAILSQVNTQQKIDDLVQNTYGGNEQALADYLNSALAPWNSYIATRPDITTSLVTLSNEAILYNASANEFNSTLDEVNAERQAIGLPPLAPLPLTPSISSDPTDYVSYEGTLIAIPTVTVPISPLSTFAVPNLSQDPTEIPTAVIVTTDNLPRAKSSEAFALLYLSFANSIFFAIHGLLKTIDLERIVTETEKAFFLKFGVEITNPSGYIRSARKEFLDTAAGTGGGVGLASLAMGLYSKNLGIALSSAIYRAVAQNASIPVSSRLFATLQFSGMELLFRSSLAAALPAAKFLLSKLGSLGGTSAAIDVAISEALIIQVNGIVGSGTIFNQVNKLLNEEYLAQGFQSLGGLESFTKSVSSTLSLSILSVALAQLGRTIGMPNLVAQLFAQAGGIPTSEVLVALTAGSRLLDVLDNPISVLFLKQTLADKLVFERGFSSESVGLMINSAVNSILLKGGINTFSQLRADFLNEFQESGFSLFEANMLTNETIGLIRGDLGVQFLNVAYGLNFDPSVIAASVVNNLLGIDSGLAGAMLSNTVNRSLLYGGNGPTTKLQNDLIEEFKKLGMTEEDAILTSNQALALIETAGLLAPLNEYPGVIDIILGGPTLSAAAYGNAVIQDEISENLQQAGLSVTQADIIADLIKSFTAKDFTAPGNLLQLSVELAIQRSVGSGIFQTQREFRNRIAEELRSVGFNLNDALYLANSAALFGLNGNLTSPYGGSVARIAAIGDSIVKRLSSDYGISTDLAAEIYNQARARAIIQAPFSSEDLYRVILTEELHRGVQALNGSNDGYQIVDRAIADLASPEGILDLAGLTEQLSAHILGVLRPDLGAKLAEENKNQILTALLGGDTIDKIESEERRNPLSTLNLIDTHVRDLLKGEDEEESRRLLRKLIQLLEALLKPNAEIGFMLQSLMDHPSTFIGSLLVQKPKGEFLDIPI